MNELFTCNNPGLLRFVKRQNAAEQGAANYLYKLVHAAAVREKKRANRCRNPYTKPRRLKVLKSRKPYLP
jgi:hypothetical protein